MQYLVCNQAICRMPRIDPIWCFLLPQASHLSVSTSGVEEVPYLYLIVPLGGSDTCTIAHGLCCFIRYLLPTVPVHSVKHILQSGEHTVELSMYLFLL